MTLPLRIRFRGDMALIYLCVYRKLDSAIMMMMKAAEDGRRYDAAPVLDGGMDRRIARDRGAWQCSVDAGAGGSRP
jgi:hypothetical protein